jgi:hypothetical protein
MSSHARHARPARSVRTRVAALRLGVVLSAAGTAAVAAGGSAQAELVDVSGVLGQGVRPAVDLDLYPMGGTGADPLDNAVGTQIADFKPFSTQALTAPISEGGSVSALTAHVSDLLAGGN